MEDTLSYGQTRKKREDITYAQIERAATDILKTGVRPTVEAVRSALGGGSPRTVLDGLNRFWRDLGNQVAGTPDTLRRLPSAVADLAEGLWQRALAIAVEAAQATSSEAEGQLARLKNQLELRSHTLSQREIELDELLRARERTVKELEEHLRAAISMLSRRDATLSAMEGRLAAAQQETEAYRERLAKMVQRAVTRQRAGVPKRVPKPGKSARAHGRSKLKTTKLKARKRRSGTRR
jgi:septal ring factor EnvC (AmiA/AmiB activator)